MSTFCIFPQGRESEVLVLLGWAFSVDDLLQFGETLTRARSGLIIITRPESVETDNYGSNFLKELLRFASDHYRRRSCSANMSDCAFLGEEMIEEKVAKYQNDVLVLNDI